jgi:restriction system protein
MEISSRTWEEIIAATFDRAGYDEVILTSRSGDHGRDVIAIRRGVCCVRIIGSVKAYKPGHLVKHDDVRALAGVVAADPKATKGIITTTSDFAPGIARDPIISPLMPYRLELMNGPALRSWLASPK